MKHWQKLNKLPIAPPSSTTSQFLTSPDELGSDESGDPESESKVDRHEWVSESRRESRVLGEWDSFWRYHATLCQYGSQRAGGASPIKRGKRGSGMVNAVGCQCGTMVDVPSKSRTRAMKTVLTTVLDVCGMLLGVRWRGGGDGQRYCMD
jgi:hypothetical protein